METPTIHHGAMFDTNELVLNMGPQHPSTHGVLRVVLRLDGEKVVDADVVIAMPNRGDERTYLAAVFVPTPAAIRLIGRSLKAGVEVPHGRDRWRFTLGDTDIF